MSCHNSWILISFYLTGKPLHHDLVTAEIRIPSGPWVQTMGDTIAPVSIAALFETRMWSQPASAGGKEGAAACGFLCWVGRAWGRLAQLPTPSSHLKPGHLFSLSRLCASLSIWTQAAASLLHSPDPTGVSHWVFLEVFGIWRTHVHCFHAQFLLGFRCCLGTLVRLSSQPAGAGWGEDHSRVPSFSRVKFWVLPQVRENPEGLAVPRLVYFLGI